MARILIVDDDPHLRELVRVYLRKEGMETYEACDGEAALRVLAETKVDLVVLDVMMPNMDGWTFVQALRSDSDIPVLMLTAKGETPQKLKGFQLGADDYLVKPFDPLELVVRVKALLRRYRIATSQVVEVGRVRLDKSTYQVAVDGAGILLPKKEFELLFTLARRPGKTFSREQLIEDIWGYDYMGDERTVDVHVKRLRDKFSEEKSGFRITTVRGLGYRLEDIS
ncbi:DNA-binding response regulator [Alicyclobacillus contaminans]|uniref:response regulator transcription factor n=1 Tax=Alicyclobacillus contaminans TaxID=392016 RepID=UPI00040E4266|nr:response regulator transcription factor [Alicyclobacillus contaminans]GMA51108.1 DNA-binding response regulator [Alicyclobacillus contaminans]